MSSKKEDTNAKAQPNNDCKNTDEKGKQSVALDAPGIASAVARRIAEDVNEYNIRKYDGGHRSHLGASLIGEECKRKLWYLFRWCYSEKFGSTENYARMMRLFNRGHREEDRFIEWLEGIGFKLWFENREGFAIDEATERYFICSDYGELRGECRAITTEDPHYAQHVARAKADGLQFPQFRVSSSMGHFGGSLDGIGMFPERYGIEEPVLLEFKTNGTGAGFNKVVDEGMPVAKPNHFAQTSTYGSDPAYRFRYCLYLIINKNDDSLHVELVKLDWNLGDQMRAKADQIITSQEPPPRLSDNPTYFKCKYCPAYDICHKGAIPEKNCRSCKFARPVDGGKWFCDFHNGVIPEDFIPNGCEHWKPITSKVSNE